jgi:hypothetical protein
MVLVDPILLAIDFFALSARPSASILHQFLQTLREAQCINKSLSFLEQTVTALARKEAHIPFRQSRLTSVLRDALGGNCKVHLQCWLLLWIQSYKWHPPSLSSLIKASPPLFSLMPFVSHQNTHTHAHTHPPVWHELCQWWGLGAAKWVHGCTLLVFLEGWPKCSALCMMFDCTENVLLIPPLHIP